MLRRLLCCVVAALPNCRNSICNVQLPIINVQNFLLEFSISFTEYRSIEQQFNSVSKRTTSYIHGRRGTSVIRFGEKFHFGKILKVFGKI